MCEPIIWDCFDVKVTALQVTWQHVKYWNTNDLCGFIGNMQECQLCGMNHQGKRGWKQAIFFARMRRIYIWGLTALTKESKPVSRRNAIGKHLLYNILYFLVDKRIKCICTWFCQHLAPDFKGNGKSGYVCQRLSTHQFYMKPLIQCILSPVNAVNREMCAYYILKMH